MAWPPSSPVTADLYTTRDRDPSDTGSNDTRVLGRFNLTSSTAGKSWLSIQALVILKREASGLLGVEVQSHMEGNRRVPQTLDQ
jgi:hypothetical protein